MTEWSLNGSQVIERVEMSDSDQFLCIYNGRMPNNATASGYEHLDTDKMRTFSYFAGIREIPELR